MRHLNNKQKGILDKWYDVNQDSIVLGFDLANESLFDIMDQIEPINNFETINQEINGYINDKISEDMNA